MTPPLLAHTRVAAPDREPERWLLVLHGIYGSGRNWSTIARRLTESRPEWGALLVDIRLHGGSTGFEPPHTLEASAADVDRLVDELDVHAAAVLGHSFGGKVALKYMEHHGDELRQAWVVESTPAAREPGGSAWRMLEVVRSVPAEFGSRQEAVEALEHEGGVSTGVAQWMAMNLEDVGGRFRWRIDLDGVEAMLRDFFRSDYWEIVDSPPAGVTLHFVKGETSDTLDADAVGRIETLARGGRIHLHTIPGGHWINAENPDGVTDLLVRNLD